MAHRCWHPCPLHEDTPCFIAFMLPAQGGNKWVFFSSCPACAVDATSGINPTNKLMLDVDPTDDIRWEACMPEHQRIILKMRVNTEGGNDD